MEPILMAEKMVGASHGQLNGELENRIKKVQALCLRYNPTHAGYLPVEVVATIVMAWQEGR